MNLTHIWKTTLSALQSQTSRHDYEALLRPAMLLSLDNGIARIGVSSPIQKEGLENRLLMPLRNALTRVVGYPVQVQVLIANQALRPEVTAAPATVRMWH